MRSALIGAAFCLIMCGSAARVEARVEGNPMANPFDEQATQLVADIVAGDFTDVLAQADPSVSAQLSVAQLANAWRTYQERFGAFQSAGQPSAVVRGELTVEQVPIQLANGDGEIRITFHPDGTIAGLFFLRSGVPVP